MEQTENYVEELNNNSQDEEQIPQERSIMEQQFWGAPRLRECCGGRLLAPATAWSSPYGGVRRCGGGVALLLTSELV